MNNLEDYKASAYLLHGHKLIGYVFVSLESFQVRQEINNFIDLSNFLVAYGSIAAGVQSNCAIYNENNDIVFYCEKGRVLYPLDEIDNWTNLLEMMRDG